jgi:hypothetical protein
MGGERRRKGEREIEEREEKEKGEEEEERTSNKYLPLRHQRWMTMAAASRTERCSSCSRISTISCAKSKRKMDSKVRAQILRRGKRKEENERRKVRRKDR